MTNTLSDLTNGGKRTRVHNAQVVFKLPEEAKSLMEKAAESQGISSAAAHRHAVAEYLQRRGYVR